MSNAVSNQPSAADLRLIGATAMANAQKADVMGKKARADMLFVITQSLEAEVHCFYQKADGAVIVNEYQPLRNLIDGDYLADWLGDTPKALTAVNDACIKELTGVDAPTTAQRDCWKAARDAAFGLYDKLGDKLPASVERTTRGNLKVPYGVMKSAPKDDAPESEHDVWNARKDGTFTIDGTRGNSFAELAKAVRPAKADDRANSGQGKVAPTTWLEAVKAKIGKATWQNQKGMDWVAYLADMSSAEVIEMCVLFSAHKGDNA